MGGMIERVGERDSEPTYLGGIERMTERLIVKNFLCLENIDIEVKDFLILIGPQAVGKSLCAKLLYYFRTSFEELQHYQLIGVLDETSDFNKILSNWLEFYFPKIYWKDQDFYIEYQRNQYNRTSFIKIRKECHKKLESYIDFGAHIISREVKPPIQPFIDIHSLEKIREFSNISPLKTRFQTLLSMNIFIPAGRSFFSLLQGTDNNTDPFLVEFGIFYKTIRQIECAIPAEVKALIRSILKGDYVYAENMLLTGARKITLELLSSGQQEALPLALVIANIISFHLEYCDFTNIYVEEPEAHLFPDAQEQISRLVSFLRYNTGKMIRFVITTHSPYMLTAFNNLIKAGNIVKQNPGLKDAVCNIIPESMHIDIEHFSAYLLKDGRAESIIDEDTRLINADAIDSVSESIMENFNALLDIESEDDKADENV
jgi:hypothetical protein